MLDKLVTNRLVSHVRSRVFLHPNKFGVTPGKSTEHALHEVRKTAEDCHARDKDTFLMLDMKRAFNNLSWPEIYAQLRRMGCLKNIYRLVISFLSNRSVLCRAAVMFLERQYDKGCPQGLNSGPFFWNQVVNSLPQLDLEEYVKVIAYADDFGIS